MAINRMHSKGQSISSIFLHRHSALLAATIYVISQIFSCDFHIQSCSADLLTPNWKPSGKNKNGKEIKSAIQPGVCRSTISTAADSMASDQPSHGLPRSDDVAFEQYWVHSLKILAIPCSPLRAIMLARYRKGTSHND